MTALFSAETPHSGMARTLTGLPTFIQDIGKLSPDSQISAGRAAELRRRLNNCSEPHKIVQTYKKVVDLMRQASNTGYEIPESVTKEMYSNEHVGLNGVPVIDHKIEAVRKEGNVTVFMLGNNKEVKLELVSGSTPQQGSELYITNGSNEMPAIKGIDLSGSYDKNKPALEILIELTGYMVDGMASASSVNQEYAKALDTGFSELRDNLPMVKAFETPNLAIERGKPFPGFNPIVGSALAGLDVELRSLVKPYKDKQELVSNFITFINKHNLAQQMDSLWTGLTELEAIVEDKDFAKFGREADALVSSAILKDMSIDSVENLRERREEYLDRFCVYKALKGTLIIMNLASRNEDFHRRYPEWVNKVAHGDYFNDITARVVEGPDSLDGITDLSSDLARNIARNAGVILPQGDKNENKVMKQRLSTLYSP